MFAEVLHADGAELMGQVLYPGTQSLCVRITPELPPFVEIDAFEQQLQLCPRQSRLALTLSVIVKASPLEAFTPQAVTAAVKIQHFHLGAESNNIPHTDRNLSLLSIDGTRCMDSD
jgi:hypothetical protein